MDHVEQGRLFESNVVSLAEFRERRPPASADVVAASIPKAERTTLAGQGHVVDPGTMAAVLRRFFG